jgi:hypothetical protein
MKTRDLFELLTERPIAHPTRIEGVTWRGRKLTITVRGYRWWESPYVNRQVEGGLNLIFDDLGDGCLLTNEFDADDDEALEHFEVRPVSEVPWAQACDWSIYCSAPIHEPMTLYGKVHDYLSTCDAFLTPERFLNQADDLSRFINMTQTIGFMIARGPRCIRDLVCLELERQLVPHSILETRADTEPKFLIRLGDSAFLCGSASAELPS